MSNGFAKTNMEDSKVIESLLPEALLDFNHELAIRMAKNKQFFGSVKLEVLFQNGKPQAHKITVDYTAKPKTT